MKYCTHQVLTYADDVNLIGDDIRTIEGNADVLLNVCKYIANIGDAKYVKVGRLRSMIANEDVTENYTPIKIVNYYR